jgi:hypothetical protein
MVSALARFVVVVCVATIAICIAAIARAEPRVADVIDAATRHAGLDGDPGRGMRRRARLAGLAPWITVRTARDYDWTADDHDPTVDHGQIYEVRATWRLDRLVFDSAEPRIAALDTSRSRARRDLARHVIALYFKRQRLRRQASLPLDEDEAADVAIDLAEVTAELDHLTGGRFAKLGGPE